MAKASAGKMSGGGKTSASILAVNKGFGVTKSGGWYKLGANGTVKQRVSAASVSAKTKAAGRALMQTNKKFKRSY